ncbi:lasso peptide isopeptide bond-forming cyclase [Rubrivirga sp.]|uniref:lasso peptide isopeptide bond-forming cyclase n=1 Tax=Rubrivirga sp. TaxID=1885344 RepID=UPI003B52286C
MSGIAGVLRLDGRPVEGDEVRRMVDRMEHRGPDGRAVWAEGSVGLGHGMLHTTRESLVERLPVAAGPFALTADARIDNRDVLIPQLRSDLSALGLDADVVPDSSVVLAAYARWGTGCVDHLLGAFAFAVWDRREGHLVCARDHLGIRRLYTTHVVGELFAFATEPKALFELDGVAPVLDEVRLAESLSARLYEPVRTSFVGVEKLPTAHVLTARPVGVTQRSYWTLEPADPAPSGSYAEGLAEIFDEAVRCRTRSALPVGSELSGGLDSSAVTVVAADVLAEGHGELPLHTVSLAYTDPQSDERQFVQAILDELGSAAVPHYVFPEREGIVRLYSEIFETLDDIRVRGNGFINYLTAREAGRHGVRVLLTGQDGDTAVGHGWEWFSEQALAGDWESLRAGAEAAFARAAADQEAYHSQLSYQRPSQIASAYVAPVLQWWAEEKKLVQFARASYEIHRHFGAPKTGPLRQYWKQILLPASVRRGMAQRAAEASASGRVPPTINPEFARRVGLLDRLAENALEKHLDGRGEFGAQETQLRTLRSGFVEGNLEKLDLYAAASGVESRHPFMDIRLIEYCLAVPSGAKLHDGWSRAVMREAMGTRLPDMVRARMNKMHYGTQNQAFVFDSEPEAVQDLLDRPGSAGAYLDLEQLRALWDRGQNEPDTFNEWEIAWLSAGITALLWLRRRESLPERSNE